jgi:hypothetical protein
MDTEKSTKQDPQKSNLAITNRLQQLRWMQMEKLCHQEFLYREDLIKINQYPNREITPENTVDLELKNHFTARFDKIDGKDIITIRESNSLDLLLERMMSGLIGFKLAHTHNQHVRNGIAQSDSHLRELSPEATDEVLFARSQKRLDKLRDHLNTIFAFRAHTLLQFEDFIDNLTPRKHRKPQPLIPTPPPILSFDHDIRWTVFDPEEIKKITNFADALEATKKNIFLAVADARETLAAYQAKIKEQEAQRTSKGKEREDSSSENIEQTQLTPKIAAATLNDFQETPFDLTPKQSPRLNPRRSSPRA